MITALAEYVDMLYTKGATMIPPEIWWCLEVTPTGSPALETTPRVSIRARTEEPKRLYKADVPFAAVEQGYRVGAEELSIVAEHHIERLKRAMIEEPTNEPA